jgi:hypothetical protein
LPEDKISNASPDAGEAFFYCGEKPDETVGGQGFGYF